jgi:hypothetical protein
MQNETKRGPTRWGLPRGKNANQQLTLTRLGLRQLDRNQRPLCVIPLHCIHVETDDRKRKGESVILSFPA